MNSICDKRLKDFSFSFNVEVSGAASASFTDQSFQWNSFALCETAKTNTVFYFHSDAVCSVMSTRLICWHIVSSHSPPDWHAVITTSCFQQGVMGKSHKLLRYIFVVVFLLLLPFTKLTLFNSPPAPTVLSAPEGLKLAWKPHVYDNRILPKVFCRILQSLSTHVFIQGLIIPRLWQSSTALQTSPGINWDQE